MDVRRCAKCGETKPLDEFAFHNRATGKRQAYCRSCHRAYRREHYVRNRARYLGMAAEWTSRLRKERMGLVVAYLRGHPCVDCGEDDVRVLEFDHIGAKEFDIARGFMDRAWEVVLAEIARCEVVCANCHRRRTAVRGRFARAVAAGRVGSAPALEITIDPWPMAERN